MKPVEADITANIKSKKPNHTDAISFIYQLQYSYKHKMNLYITLAQNKLKF